MHRVIPIAVVCGLCLTLWLAADGGPTLTSDAQQLHGVWVSPPLQLDEDLEGRVELAFAFPGDKASGQARLNVVPTDQLAPPLTVGPLQAVVKEGARQVMLEGQDPASRRPDAHLTLSYELVGDELRLTSPEPFRHPTLPFPVELSGSWRREGKW